jgi:deoxyribodipyrimidine photo-lyase
VKRNYDTGPEGDAAVSQLSPWIRNRMLPEWDVLTAVLQRQDRAETSKFIDEVCWRTYWKGWLQLRPSIWEQYLDDRITLLQQFAENIGYQKAIEGRTGIECFDIWNTELLENNYLHNHARMWYASIWIHTLRLPWELGADWFLRHLMDGDPASNTLSWRWVSGLHTPGKTYLARPDNIRKYTNGRFRVEEDLATEAVELNEATIPKPRQLPQPKEPPKNMRLGLLVTEEDLSAANWLSQRYAISASAKCFPFRSYEALDIRPEVIDFRYQALAAQNDSIILKDMYQLVNWAKQEHLEGIVTATPTVGHWPEILKTLKAELSGQKIELFTARHWWDETLFPHATKGFFRFKKAIPEALNKLSIERT